MRGYSPVFRTLGHFIGDGIVMGMTVGALMGTLLLPIFGTISGFMIGCGVGFVLGILCGIVVNAVNESLLHEATVLSEYRRTLTRKLGRWSLILFGGGAFVLFIAATWSDASRAFPRQEIPMQQYQGIFFSYMLLFVMVMAAFILPIVVAMMYSASRYADRVIAPLLTKKNEDVRAMHWLDNPGADKKFAGIALKKAGWLILAGGIFGGFIHHHDVIQRSGWALNFGAFASGALAGTLVVGAITLTLILMNTFVLVLVNRLYFDEYARSLSMQQYQHRLMIALGLVTLVYGVIVTAVFFAPVAAIIAALSAREYAVWHYGHEDKRKNDVVRAADA